jgi:E3 ubiquitin-protein ligase SHPRH
MQEQLHNARLLRFPATAEATPARKSLLLAEAQHVVMAEPPPLSSFVSQSTTDCLLCSAAEAQHVVLAEPLLDPAVEAQAVGRVDRIGQTRSTHVHRFVVERTIEENVHRLCQQRAAAMDLSAASVKRAGGTKEQGALTVRDVALLLRQPEEEAVEEELPGGQQQQQQQQTEQQQQQQQQTEQQQQRPGAVAASSPRERAAAAAAARAAAAAAGAAGHAP